MVREACDGLTSAVKFRLQARNAMGHSCWSAWSESSTRGTENARFHAGGCDNPEHQNPENPECLEVEPPNLNALGIHFTLALLVQKVRMRTCRVETPPTSTR